MTSFLYNIDSEIINKNQFKLDLQRVTIYVQYLHNTYSKFNKWLSTTSLISQTQSQINALSLEFEQASNMVESLSNEVDAISATLDNITSILLKKLN